MLTYATTHSVLPWWLVGQIGWLVELPDVVLCCLSSFIVVVVVTEFFHVIIEVLGPDKSYRKKTNERMREIERE